ncbi:MAG: hypothetical protein RLZ42_318, partial [Armatimonadota bacterium]
QHQLQLTAHPVVVLHAFLDTFRCDFHGFTRCFTATELLLVITATSSDEKYTYHSKNSEYSLHTVPYGLEVYQLPSAR